MSSVDTPIPLRGNAKPLQFAIAIAAVAALFTTGFFGFRVVASLLHSDPPRPDSLQLVIAGIPSELIPAVPIRGGTSATFTLDRADGRYARTLDISFASTGPTTPASFAVDAIASMRFMDHDQFTAAGVADAKGHVRVPLNFAMPGEWQIDLTVETPEGPASVSLFAEIWS